MDAYRGFARRFPAWFICINLVLALLWITVIMGFSGEDSEESGARSSRIPVGIINIVAPSADITLENYESVEALQNTEKALRKAAHMFEYGVFASFVWAVFFGFRNLSRRYAYIMPVIAVICLGCIDENNQTRISGRFGSWVDVCVDAVGAVVAVFIAYRLTMRYRRLKRGCPHPGDGQNS
jgi:VanZ family protein